MQKKDENDPTFIAVANLEDEAHLDSEDFANIQTSV